MKREQFNAPLDTMYLKQHPTKNYLTVINPMGVIQRLNDCLTIGGWQFRTELISCEPIAQGSRQAFEATVKGILTCEQNGIHFEQFGGSINDDRGDAMKGAATDALTKCASYLEIGFEIYSGEKDREKEDARPWLTDQQYKDAVNWMRSDVPTPEVKALKWGQMKKDYRMKKAYRDTLEKLAK